VDPVCAGFADFDFDGLLGAGFGPDLLRQFGDALLESRYSSRISGVLAKLVHSLIYLCPSLPVSRMAATVHNSSNHNRISLNSVENCERKTVNHGATRFSVNNGVYPRVLRYSVAHIERLSKN